MVWDVPPEPGLEVTVVRDCDGDLWWRTSHGWKTSQTATAPPVVPGGAAPWRTLLLYVPLLDVTAEYPDYRPPGQVTS